MSVIDLKNSSETEAFEDNSGVENLSIRRIPYDDDDDNCEADVGVGSEIE